jgi:hypothetical protein
MLILSRRANRQNRFPLRVPEPQRHERKVPHVEVPARFPGPQNRVQRDAAPPVTTADGAAFRVP